MVCVVCVSVTGGIVVIAVFGSKRHSLQAVELSQRIQTAVQIVSKPPAPRNVARFTSPLFNTIIIQLLGKYDYVSRKRYNAPYGNIKEAPLRFEGRWKKLLKLNICEE